jgi:ribosome maturation factor RimP
MTAIQPEIEERLAREEPSVEVLLAEVLPGGLLRVFIDHPDGVTLALCERVSGHLADLRERYSLEVSSPGVERPLTKPSHFRRFVGRRARVRTGRAESSRPAAARRAGAGVRGRSITGELVGASDSEITLAAEGGVIAIPYSEIRRSNLVEE